ncbi:MAG: hypothetical protein II958_01010 [Spirochaetia bacterium]|nr:hypothetical protein [Spirochaetia bacterium]
MKKGLIIAAAVLLALLAAAGVMIQRQQKEDSPPVRIIEDTADKTPSSDNNDALLNAQNAQIEEQRARIKALEDALAQHEFDYAALKAERDRLKRQSADIEEQNRVLRGRNNTLRDDYDTLKRDSGKELADLRAQIDDLDQKLSEQESEHIALLAQIEEYKAQQAAQVEEAERAQAAERAQLAESAQLAEPAEQAQATESVQVAEAAECVQAAKPAQANLPGQSRNIVGLKIGGSDIDLEATIALMPHWFLIADLAAVETPDDFVEEEFPGLTAKHAFLYTALLGTGFNWRFNSLQPQPNFYISTMIGPAWYVYNNDTGSDLYKTYSGGDDYKTYLLWRTSIGFDMILYKNLQFTTDLSFDYMKDYFFTPHLTVGLQWSFSSSWALFGKK